MNAAGRHLIAELEGCEPRLLSDVAALRRHLEEAARTAGGTVLGSQFHRFDPIGASGVVLLAESHVSIHTWPEWRYAAVDVFGCGARMVPLAAVRHIATALRASDIRWLEVTRGVSPEGPVPPWRHERRVGVGRPHAMEVAVTAPESR
jgi:S-adenosylmethionine decarboxylase proenzyme